MESNMIKWMLVVIWLNGSQGVFSYDYQFECEQAKIAVMAETQSVICVPVNRDSI